VERFFLLFLEEHRIIILSSLDFETKQKWVNILLQILKILQDYSAIKKSKLNFNS